MESMLMLLAWLQAFDLQKGVNNNFLYEIGDLMETGVFPFTSKVRAQNDVIPEYYRRQFQEA